MVFHSRVVSSRRLQHGATSEEDPKKYLNPWGQPLARSCRADLQIGNANDKIYAGNTSFGDACGEFHEVLTQDPAPVTLSKEDSLSDCPVFYLHAKNYTAQDDMRKKNVDRMIEMDQSIRVMEPIYWKSNEKLMYDTFAKLQLPVCTNAKNVKFGQCFGQLPQGQFGRFLAQVVAAAYQVKFGLNCMVTMEDDIALPPEFRDRLSQFAIAQDKPRVWRLLQWGEGTVFNLAGAREYIERLYRHGIFLENDQFVIRFLKDMDSAINIGISKIVATNAGDISSNEGVPSDYYNDKFDYTSSVSSKPMERLMNTFKSENDLNMVDVLTRFTQGQTVHPL